MLQERLTNLALISIEKEFLLVNLKNEAVQIFSDRRGHSGKRNIYNRKYRQLYLLSCLISAFFCWIIRYFFAFINTISSLVGAHWA